MGDRRIQAAGYRLFDVLWSSQLIIKKKSKMLGLKLTTIPSGKFRLMTSSISSLLG